MDFLANTFFGNTIQEWLLATLTGVATFVVLRLIAVVAVSRLATLAKGTSSHLDDVVMYSLQKTKGLLVFIVSLYVAGRVLELPSGIGGALESLTVIALLAQTGIWIGAGIKRWVEFQRAERAAEDGASVMTMNVLGIAARMVLWSMVVLLALENLGVDVTALVAGLGIGGVAVALAAQSVLGDLFASLSIVLDRPFVLGDFLIVGDFLGSVEEIGLKTTRVRSLSGEQLIFSNADLLNSRIRNYGRMFERRVVFEIGVTYQTPRSSLETIPGMIRETVERQGEQVRFDRSHFKQYGDFAIIFETVYYVLAADYNVYMDVQQAINLAIHEYFEDEGIEFAYPTQTLFLQHQEGPAGAAR